MRTILAFVALLAMVGCSLGLNPQPEPPAPMGNLLELGRVVLTDKVLTIDMGTVIDEQDAINTALDQLSNMNIPQNQLVLIANGNTYAYEKAKKTDYFGNYHFKAVTKHVMPSYNMKIGHVNSTKSDLTNFGSDRPFGRV